MSKTIAIHSFRGGTGKSFISVNLALTSAMKGENVCILDLDFRAPTLGMTFRGVVPKCTLNDYLDGYCKVEDVLVDVSSLYNTKGKLLVGLASHSSDRIQESMVKGRSWWMKALERLHLLEKALANNFGIDFVFLDTSPGVLYSSINAIYVSDIVLSVISLDESDVDGTKGTIESVYKPLEKKVLLLFEKYPVESGPSLKKAEIEEVHEMLKPLKTSLVGIIPCSCKILRSKRSSIFILENPDHPLKEIMVKLSEKIGEAL